MAVTEYKDSREMHVTMDGTTLTAIYDCTWDDWDNQVADLPRIGDYWYGRPDMICTDITTRTHDNTNCRITAIFSTDGMENIQRLADQAGSWTDTMDVQLTEVDSDKYHRLTDGSDVNFVDEWLALSVTHTIDNKPLFSQSHVSPTLFVRCYGSTHYISRLLDNVNHVNSDRFLEGYTALKALNQPYYKTDVTSENDIEKWKLSGVRATLVRAGVYEYEFVFQWSPGGWNTQHGVDHYMYGTAVFMDLFDGMDLNEDASGIGLRG